jgi:uncharacterized protein
MTNIEVVKKYFTALETGNLGGIDEILSDEIVWHQPGQGPLSGTRKGKQQVFDLFASFMRISENSFKIDRVQEIMVNQDLVTVNIHFSAHKRSGQAISMNGVDLMRIQDGKISEVFLFSADQIAEDKFWI